jgi:hypothetical protein
MKTSKRKTEEFGEKPAQCHYATNFTRTDPGANTGLRRDSPPINRSQPWHGPPTSHSLPVIFQNYNFSLEFGYKWYNHMFVTF